MKLSDIIQEYRKRAQVIGLQPTVLADGSPDARIAIVAEAPGAREVELRTPLVGPTGKFLWQTLQRIGIRRSDCYITNVVKRQIHFSEYEREKITRHELDHWCELLRWELQQLPNCAYVLVLGGQALQATLGHTGIEKWRGSCLQDERGRWYIVANNPAAILRAPYLESTFNMDIHKLSLCMQDKYVVPSIHALTDPSPEEAIRWIDKMQDERLPVSLDIETHADETACVGLANSVDSGMCINFRDRSSNRWLLRDELRVRLRLSAFLSNPSIRVVAQNGIFDSAWLWYKDRLHIHRVWFDTLLAHHTLYPTLPHDLGFLTAQYTHHPYYKDERQVWKEGGDIRQYWEYNVKDCCITLACYHGLECELREQKLDQFFHDHVMRLQPHLIEMTINGVSVDLNMKRNLDEQLGAEVERLRQEFVHAARTATGEEGLDVNPGSPRQLADLYFSRLRLVARSNSTDKSNREAMLKHPGTSAQAKDLILAHNRYADAKKLHSTYVVTTVDDDGRYRSEFRQFGTQSAPGRLSSTGTLWGSGGNFQNQPPKIRPMYIAPPGYEFFYFDLAQAEARVVAYEANIQVWKEQFERARLDGSYDAHRALASEMFRVAYDEVPTIDFDQEHKPTIRYIAKRCRHGLNYRMMHERLAEVTKLPVVEALRIWMIYHRTTPELQVWWKALEHEVTSSKMLFNAYGRRLLYLGPLTEEALESIVAFKPQSLVGDHCTRVIYQSHDDDRWPEHSRILINVHDSLTGIAPIGRGKDCLRICKEYAEAPITIKGEQLIIPADLALSQPDEQGIHRWSNLKKFKLSEYGSASREATPVLTVSM
jgi:uracil-DNA glycosylase family 4